jgi:hypothetical protein
MVFRFANLFLLASLAAIQLATAHPLPQGPSSKHRKIVAHDISVDKYDVDIGLLEPRQTTDCGVLGQNC